MMNSRAVRNKVSSRNSKSKNPNPIVETIANVLEPKENLKISISGHKVALPHKSSSLRTSAETILQDDFSQQLI